MITKEEAKKKVLKAIGEDIFNVKDLKHEKRTFVFLAETKDKEVVPNKMIVALDAETGKTGFSIVSVNEAIDASRK